MKLSVRAINHEFQGPMEWSEYAPTDPYEVAMNNEFTAFWLTVRSHQLISPLVELPKND